MGTGRHHDDESDWVERAVELATRVGLNGIRVRWKLTRVRLWMQKASQSAENRTRHVHYEHAVCPHCGRVQDRETQKCVKCGEPLTSRRWQIVQRIGVVVPHAISVSTLLCLLILVAYFRLMIARPGGGYLSVDTDVLIQHGAYWLPAILAGEYWRHATAIFGHIGLLHLGFNVIALAQIGPAIEQVFGRGRMLFFFMFTGVGGFVACQLWGMQAPSAGASGAIMGLIGAAAGWGHRDASPQGRAVRNQMLKWLVYTTVFGILVNANHVAHGGGFLLGAVLGYLTPSRLLRRSIIRPADVLLGVVGLAAAAVAVALVIRPPASSQHWARAIAASEAGDESDGAENGIDATTYYTALGESCALRSEGKTEEANLRLRRALPNRPNFADFPVDDPRLCQQYRQMREHCLEIRDGGVDSPEARGDRADTDRREQRRRDLDEAWNDLCPVLLRPVRPPTDAESGD
jgi:rhomboid protease GluP